MEPCFCSHVSFLYFDESGTSTYSSGLHKPNNHTYGNHSRTAHFKGLLEFSQSLVTMQVITGNGTMAKIYYSSH